jgi:hypothetical protein
MSVETPPGNQWHTATVNRVLLRLERPEDDAARSSMLGVISNG